MDISKAKARRAAVFFLIVLGVFFVLFAAYSVYLKVGPQNVVVARVPFGLPGGWKLPVGDSPDTLRGLDAMPFSTRQELHRAAELEKSGEFESAAEIYEAIALQYPGAFLAEWGVAVTLLSMDSLSAVWQSQLDRAVSILKRDFVESSVAFYLDARLAERANSPGTALELSRIAAEKAPAFADARLLYADLLYRAGRFAESGEEARAAISLYGGNEPRAYARLAWIFHDEGHLDSCGLVVEHALSKFPGSPSLLCLQGFLFEYRGNFDRAEDVYRRALAIRPGFSPAKDALLTLGEKSPPGAAPGGARLSPKERVAIAYEILQPLVKQYPDNLPLREALGEAYLRGRDFDMAKSQFLEIRRQDPSYPEIESRIGRASSVPTREGKKNLLADDLNRALDSMRTLPQTEHSFESSLGHYLVRYGASEKEFFSKYSVGNFKKIGQGTWQEVFFEAPYFHRYTILFDKSGHFYGVHVVVSDSGSVLNKAAANAPEIYTSMLLLNSRISGVGTETGETDCDGTVISGATWETRDNFEMLARIVGKPDEVRMIRLDRSKIPEGARLCDNVKYLLMF